MNKLHTTDRRTLSEAPAGRRARELAAVIQALADTLRLRADQSADAARTEYGHGFADGMAQAYEAAADMIRHHARHEDAR
jgi:acyl-CoA reductase-like NAD-dependent aldehyde dehydrogenase